MDYTKCITAAIDFIENNLFDEIAAAQVARNIGFSEYHFHRIFQGMIGESIATYIRRRRLSEMAILLINSNKSIYQLASVSGFESHEAFTRAFKKMYGVSPIQFRKQKNTASAQHKIKLTPAMLDHLQTGITLKPHFKIKGPELVVGMADSYSGSTEENFIKISQLWKRFIKQKHHIAHIKEGYALGVCLPNLIDTSNHSGQGFIYMAGLPVTSLSKIPEGMDSCIIPKTNYAVFTHKGALATLPTTINYIWGTWIPKNIEQYQHVNMPDFELYDSRFDPLTESGEFDVYIPIEHS